jgi:GNAT superfamily N-acetyltransferase
MQAVDICPMTAFDVEAVAEAFRELGWPGKGATLDRRYLDEQEKGDRATFVATLDGVFAGYVTVVWVSDYEPFRNSGIPEISDLNVLPGFRRGGIGSALMDAAEQRIRTRSSTFGLGVGLYADYAAAHLMYLKRGYLPDRQGLIYQNRVVEPGSSVRVDDDLVLMMTRSVAGHGARVCQCGCWGSSLWTVMSAWAIGWAVAE